MFAYNGKRRRVNFDPFGLPRPQALGGGFCLHGGVAKVSPVCSHDRNRLLFIQVSKTEEKQKTADLGLLFIYLFLSSSFLLLFFGGGGSLLSCVHLCCYFITRFYSILYLSIFFFTCFSSCFPGPLCLFFSFYSLIFAPVSGANFHPFLFTNFQLSLIFYLIPNFYFPWFVARIFQ